MRQNCRSTSSGCLRWRVGRRPPPTPRPTWRESTFICCFKIGLFPASFIFISSFPYSWNYVDLKFADDWIRTADLWCRKPPLYQLRHNHCPNFVDINEIYHYFIIDQYYNDFIKKLSLMLYHKLAKNWRELDDNFESFMTCVAKWQFFTVHLIKFVR